MEILESYDTDKDGVFSPTEMTAEGFREAEARAVNDGGRVMTVLFAPIALLLFEVGYGLVKLVVEGVRIKADKPDRLD